MLDGITVLNHYYNYSSALLFYAIAIGLFIIGILMWVGVYDEYNDFEDISMCIVAVIISLLLSVPIGYSLHEGKLATDTVLYDVTIDDSVDFNEFNDKYEIIMQKGKIFTIQEK